MPTPLSVNGFWKKPSCPARKTAFPMRCCCTEENKKEEFKQKANEEGYIDVNMTTTNGMNAVLNDDMPF